MTLNGQEIFSIGETSNICKISVSSIRYYDEKGLIIPAYINPSTGYRYYDWDSIVQLSLLRTYKHYGFTLQQCKKILYSINNHSQLDKIEAIFHEKLSELDNHVFQLKVNYTSLKNWYELIHLANTIWQMDEVPIEMTYFHKISTFKTKPQSYQKHSLKSLVVNADFTNQYFTDDKQNTNKELFINIWDALYIDFSDLDARINNDFSDCTLYIQRNPLCKNDDNLVDFGGFPSIVTYHRGNPNNINETYNKIYEWADKHCFVLGTHAIEQYILDWWTIMQTNLFVIKIIFPIV